jgi:cysteinyl-tRNA synthetase
MRVYRILEFQGEILKVEPVINIPHQSIAIIKMFGYAYDSDYEVIFDIDSDNRYGSIKVVEARKMLRIQLREDKINSILDNESI